MSTALANGKQTRDALQQFCDCVFEATDVVEIRPIRSAIREAQSSTWHEAGELPRHSNRLLRMNGDGLCIYAGANPRNRMGGKAAEDVALARCLFADFDGIDLDGARGRWQSAGLPEPTLVISSGHGVHAYWRLTAAIADFVEWTALQKSLIAALNSDKSIHDPPRIMRLPGFENRKADPIPCRVVESHPSRRFSVSDLRLILQPLPTAAIVESPKQPSTNGHHGLIEKCWAAMVKVQTKDGADGSRRLLAVARQAVRYDLSDADALELIDRYHRAFPFARDWSEAEILRRLRDAEKKTVRGSEIRNEKPVVIGDPSAHAIPSIRSDAGQTDLANGRRLVVVSGEDFRYIPQFKKFAVYDGARFAIDHGPRMEALAKKISILNFKAVAAEVATADRQTTESMLRFARYSAGTKGITAMQAMARSEPGIAVEPEQLDADAWLLNLPNGTIDLKAITLRPHNRADLITKLCPTPYDPDADCPQWRAMVKTITAGNEMLIGFLRRLAGLWLTGSAREHILPVFYGDGSNGKTTYLGAIMHMLGTDYSMKATQELLMVKRNDTHSTERADLFGMRLVLSSETEEGRRFAESLVKDLTGGERVRARKCFQDNSEVAQTWKIVVCTNHRPVVRGSDFGIWRRLKCVPFTVKIPEAEQDKDLSDKLKAEASGILNWCLFGLQQYLAEGLGEPAEVREATASYRADMDVLQRFIDECCAIAAGHKCRASAFYKAYKSWCESVGEQPANEQSLRKAITEKGFERKPNNGIWYLGIGLNSDDKLPIEAATEGGR